MNAEKRGKFVKTHCLPHTAGFRFGLLGEPTVNTVG